MVSFEGQAPDDVVKKVKFTFMGNKATISKGGETFNAKIKMDFTKNKPEIDMEMADGVFKGQIYLGHFELKKDVLEIRFGFPGNERPNWFDSGKIHLHMILKKIK